METGYVKYLTDDEFDLIMQEVDKVNSKPFQMCFKMMAYLGLRISDATHLKEINIYKDYSLIRYLDKKTKVIQEKCIPQFLQLQLKLYYCDWQHKFVNGYIFPPAHKANFSGVHLSPSTIRAFFVKFRRKHGFDKPYYVCKDGKKLYRISPHTLKHYCLYKYYKGCGNDLIATKSFSGHKEMKHTIRYCEHLDCKEQQQEILDKIWEKERKKVTF